MTIEQPSFEDNSKNKENEQKGPELEIKGEVSPEDREALRDLSQKTVISEAEYQTLYGLLKQAQIVNNVEGFIFVARAPKFDWLREKLKNMPLKEVLGFLGSKSAEEIVKEDENFKKLMDEE